VSAPDPDAGPSTLAAARLARGLSPAQAAEQMRLTSEMVLAMEEGRFEVLGPPVFARGHLRKYAALVGVPVDQVLAAYDGSASRVAESSLIPPASAHTPVRHGHGGRLPTQALLVAVLVVVALAMGGWWIWQSRRAPAEVAGQDGGSSMATPLPADGSLVPQAVPEAMPAPGEDAAAPDETVPGAGDEQPIGPATSGSLTIEFTGPCWLEVYDATGQRLAFELAGIGDVRSFDGPAPWRLVIGNTAAARVSIAGDPVPIPASLRVRDAALVLVSAAGEVGPARAVRAS